MRKASDVDAVHDPVDSTQVDRRESGEEATLPEVKFTCYCVILRGAKLWYMYGYLFEKKAALYGLIKT